MNHDLEVYLGAIFGAVRDRMASFRSATSYIVETHSAVPRHDTLFVLTRVDDRLVALASWSSITTISGPLGPSEGESPSLGIV